jgi:hypothetical protein
VTPRTCLKKDPTFLTRKTSSPNSFEGASSGNTAWFSRVSFNLVGLPKRQKVQRVQLVRTKSEHLQKRTVGQQKSTTRLQRGIQKNHGLVALGFLELALVFVCIEHVAVPLRKIGITASSDRL